MATSLNNLALLFQAQGRYETAVPLFKRALAIYEKALGPDNPSVATGLNNLAGLFQAQGRYEAAEPLYRRALEQIQFTPVHIQRRRNSFGIPWG